MEDSAESVSICCDLNVILLTSLIVLAHPPRSMSNCCTTKLIYAKMGSSQSRRSKLSAMRKFIDERNLFVENFLFIFFLCGMEKLLNYSACRGGNIVNIQCLQDNKINITDEFHSLLIFFSRDSFHSFYLLPTPRFVLCLRSLRENFGSSVNFFWKKKII